MDLTTMTDDDLERSILRISQALGGGGGGGVAPRKLSPREKSDTEWRLERIAQEMGVLERPRSYELPEAAGPHMRSGFRDEGILRDDELAARPDAEGWDPRKLSPKFSRETGIYALPSGKVTNVGSRGTPAYQEDEGASQKHERLQQEKRRLEQALAGHEAAVRMEEHGVQEAGDYSETKEGFREQQKAELLKELIKSAGKEDQGPSEEDRIDFFQKQLEIYTDPMRPLRVKDPKTGKMREATRREVLQRIKEEWREIAGQREAPRRSGAGIIEADGRRWNVDNLRSEAKADPEKWKAAVNQGLIPEAVVEAVESTRVPSPAKDRGSREQLSVSEMVQEIRQAKQSRERPRLDKLRKADPDTYRRAFRLYREGQKIPGSNLRVLDTPGQKNPFEEAWGSLSSEERQQAMRFEQAGHLVFDEGGKIYAEYMGKKVLIGPKGEEAGRGPISGETFKVDVGQYR